MARFKLVCIDFVISGYMMTLTDY